VSLADGNRTRDDVPALDQRRSCPARVAGRPTTCLSAWEADEAARRGKRLGGWRPQRGRSARQGLLVENELFGGLWPLAHRRILNRVRHATPAELAEVVRAKGVRDARVLEAFEHVARAGFVPSELAADAYLDKPLPIPHEQVTTQPSLVAMMVEALGLTGDERLLEIGTGYGFQSALLARLAAFVWSVERWQDLAHEARTNLARSGVANIEVLVGDGSEGLPAHAPYAAILVSAAFPSVPRPLADQLAEGGRLVQPIGPGGCEEVLLFEKRAGTLTRRRLVTGAHFVPLYGSHGFAP
jgi:protein-L-isoaspartate(D-aspartate) O-methyltransferase